MRSKKRRPQGHPGPPRTYGGLCRLCNHVENGVKRFEMRKASPARCSKCGGMLDYRWFKPGHTPGPVKERPRGNRILLGRAIDPVLESVEEALPG